MTAPTPPGFPRILPLGDSGVTVEFGDSIAPATNDQVIAFAQGLDTLTISGVVDVAPTYRSVSVYFDPLLIDPDTLERRLRELAANLPQKPTGTGRTIEIPVAYGVDLGPDLADVARLAGVSEQEVVALHGSMDYRVYMLGFSPGFPYLGTVPAPIAIPRLAEPRTKVQAGSVGIAGTQTGIYPQESPGGWRLIGRTPVKLYDPHGSTPFLFAPGDHVRFVEVSHEEYWRMAGPE